MKNPIEKKKILQAKVKELNLQIANEKQIAKVAKENAKIAKANAKLAKNELITEFEKEFKNPFKLFNFYTKNIDLIRVKELNPTLPQLNKDGFFELFDKAKETKKLARIANLETKKELAISENDLTKANTIDKAIIKAKQKPASEFVLPFTLNTLLSLIR